MVSDIRMVRELVALMSAHGVSRAVVSPGSRNAPISNTLHYSPEIKTNVVVDERSAAFFALGMALRDFSPVAIVCTSGSALLNYAPALAEAMYRQIPLVVITADRPKERIDQGEGQSIRQVGALQNVVKKTFELVYENSDDRLARYNFRLINEALNLAMDAPCGPVHINVPLREELYEMLDELLPAVKPILIRKPALSPDAGVMESLAKRFSVKKKVLILTGMMAPDANLLRQLELAASSGRFLVMTESTSNLHSSHFICCTDRLITTFTEDETRAFAPDLLITFGHSLISGKVKILLRSYENMEHWHVGYEGIYDTFECLTESIAMLPADFLEAMPVAGSNEYYALGFLLKDRKISTIQSQFMARAPFSDLKAFEIILKNIPKGQTLELGNSSVVRYAQLFESISDSEVFSNRGVSGIDGCTSTAAGGAFASGLPTTLISGDLAFLYDSNALWSLPLSSQLKIIVINNGGGNIFRIIEGPDRYSSTNDVFVAKHNKRVKPLVEAHGIKCFEANDEDSLRSGLTELYICPGPAVLEVHTPDEMNPQVLKDYFKHLKITSNAD